MKTGVEKAINDMIIDQGYPPGEKEVEDLVTSWAALVPKEMEDWLRNASDEEREALTVGDEDKRPKVPADWNVLLDEMFMEIGL